MTNTATSDALQTEYFVLKDDSVGLDGVIAVHSTALGPGAGGCRFWSYPTRAAMMGDAARLARGMTYKNAMADLPLGGAKAVLRRPEGTFDREALLRAFGREVEKLGGRYVTAEDVGTSVSDMEVIARETRHVAGLAQVAGQPGGDPSPWTARGVFVAMEHLARTVLERPLAECTVAIQGVGNVGGALARMLYREGAKLVVADTDAARLAKVAAETGAMVAATDQVLEAKADIFAPCALGAVLNADSIPKLRARVVCGAANNQLASDEDGDLLTAHGVVYAPDYVVNAGGIVNVAAEHLGWDEAEVVRRIDATAERLTLVLAHAAKAGVATNLAADALARERVLASTAARLAA